METDHLITTAALVLGGYLLGSVPTAYLIARARGVNVFEIGTRNPGAANTFRTVGRVAGAAVFLTDALKGIIPVALARIIEAPDAAIAAAGAAGAAAIVGHWYPVFLGFRGGAGLATAVGAGLALTPLYGAVGLACGALSVTLLRNTVHGAAVGYVALVVAGIVFGADWLATAVAVSLSAVVGLRSLAIERLRKCPDTQADA